MSGEWVEIPNADELTANELEAASDAVGAMTKKLFPLASVITPNLRETAALKTTLPWLIAHVEETLKEMGEDYWSYGWTEGNRQAIATFLRYHHEQGLSPKLLEPEELFAPESLESFVI